MNPSTLPKLLLSLTLVLLPHTEAKIPGSSGQAQSVQAPTAAKTFANPIVSSGSPDPFIAFWKGHYYLTYTTGTDIRIRTARSLADLNSAPEQNVWADFEPQRSSNVWAPELHRLKGPNGYRWYVYYTAGTSECCNNQRSFVLESKTDNPLGPYDFKARVFAKQNDFWAIDGTVLEQAGALFYLWSGGEGETDPPSTQIYIAPMSNPWTLSGPRVEISRATELWETVARGVNEGPAVLRANGRFYVTYSGSGCWTDAYALGQLTAPVGANLLYPKSWTKRKRPILQTDVDARAVAPGHNGFFSSPDGRQTWTVYHANPDLGLECKDSRTARAQRVFFDKNGNILLNKPANLGTPLELPSGDPGPQR